MTITVLDADREALRASVRGICGRQASLGRLVHLIETRPPSDAPLWNELAEAEMLGLVVSPDLGGGGATVAEAVLVAEELGRCASAVPYLSSVVASSIISTAASPVQRDQWLPELISGRSVGVLVDLTDASAQSAVAVRVVGDAAILSGAVDHLVDLPCADVLVVVFDVDGSTTLAVLDRSTAGVQITETACFDLTRRMGSLALESVEVPMATTADGCRFALDAARALTWVLLAADCLGGAHQVLESTAAYAAARQQFGRPIGSFQAVKHLCADMFIEVAMARAAVLSAAEALTGSGSGAQRAARAAKVRASNAYSAVAGASVQVHGGIGFTWEHSAHVFLRRAKFAEALYGSTAAHLEAVATAVIDDRRNLPA